MANRGIPLFEVAVDVNNCRYGMSSLGENFLSVPVRGVVTAKTFFAVSFYYGFFIC